MTRKPQGLSVGWILVSYFMVAGGAVFGLILLGLIASGSSVAVYGSLFAGGAFGGFFAGRASEGKTILEPAIAGAALIASLIGLLMLVPGMRGVFAVSGSEQVIGHSIGLGIAMGGGGLVGAALGERTSPGQRSNQWFRWTGISALISLGILFFAMMLLAIVLLRSGDALTNDAGAIVGMGGLGACALFGPMIAQAIAPRRMAFACGLGYVVVVAASMVWGTSTNDTTDGGAALVGFIVVGGAGLLIGAGGARFGWALFGKDRVPPEAAQAFE